MAGTVLGKRTRSAAPAMEAPPADISPRVTRSKRKTDFVIASDENENPFVSRKARKTSHNGGSDCMDLDELAIENSPISVKKSPVRPKPSRIGQTPQKSQLSSRKVESNTVEETHDENEAPCAAALSNKSQAPSTPRHRDALAKKIPITPRHRLGLVSRPTTPHTPHTPSTPHHHGPSVYNLARQTFARGSNSGKLVGRDQEKAELYDFLARRIEENGSGCLYVSGPPGTGKSALINEACDEILDQFSFERSYVNCMSVKTAKDISSKVLEDFAEFDVLEGAEAKTLKKLFSKQEKSHLIVLDEVDHLLDVDIDLLYQVFEWSMQPNSNLIVIGIANALDFTDRFLPRLKSRGLKPQLLPFMPYSVAQIATVLTTKLKALLPEQPSTTPDFVPFLHPTAIQFAAKKVAAQTGDLRKAFAIASRAIDLVETETRVKLGQSTAEITPSPTPSPAKTPLMENIHLSSPATVRSPKKTQRLQDPLLHLTAETAPRASIAHMARVTAAVFSNGSTQRLAALNLQQKAIMCSIFVLEQRLRARAESDVTATPSRASNAPTVKALHAAYTGICKEDNILHALTSTEFRDVLSSLETLSLISWVDGKNGTFVAMAPGTPSRRGGRLGGFSGMKVMTEEKRVASSVGVKELKESLKGPAADILLQLLAGEGL